MRTIYNLKNNHPGILLATILLLSLAFKLIVFFIFYHGDYAQISQPDTDTYVIPAQFIATHHGFWHSLIYVTMFERTPGYPLFLAAVFSLFGMHLAPVVFAQILLSSVLMICAYFIAKRLFSTSVGLIAAVVVSFNFLFITYSYFILSDIMSAIWLSLFFALGVSFYQGSRYPKAIVLLMGLVLAIATLTRPMNYYLILPVIIGTVIYCCRAHFSVQKAIALVLCLTLPTVLFVGGWQLRNKVRFDTFAYSNIAAYNLYWQFSAGIMQKNKSMTHDQAVSYLKSKIKNLDGMTVREANSVMIKKSFEIFKRYPGDLLLQMLSGFPKLMLSTDPSILWFVAPKTDFNVIHDLKADLLKLNLKKLYHKTSMRDRLNLLVLIVTEIIAILGFLFGITGIIASRDRFRKMDMAQLFLTGCLLYYIILSSNFISYARFRVPFELILNIYASYGVVCFFRYFFGRRSKVKAEQMDSLAIKSPGSYRG